MTILFGLGGGGGGGMSFSSPTGQCSLNGMPQRQYEDTAGAGVAIILQEIRFREVFMICNPKIIKDPQRYMDHTHLFDTRRQHIHVINAGRLQERKYEPTNSELSVAQLQLRA